MNNYNKLVQNSNNLMSSDLIQLIYVGEYTRRTTTDVFEHINQNAIKYNQNNQITGFLCNGGKYFMQYLEGTKDAVLTLMKKIFADDRHKKLDIVTIKKIEVRDFTRWDMRSLSMDEIQWTKQFKKTAHAEQLRSFLPFEPRNWQGWYRDTFVGYMKDIDNNESYNFITFSKLDNSYRKHKVLSYLGEDDIPIRMFYMFMILAIGILTVMSSVGAISMQ